MFGYHDFNFFELLIELFYGESTASSSSEGSSDSSFSLSKQRCGWPVFSIKNGLSLQNILGYCQIFSYSPSDSESLSFDSPS